ncbi:hypothetical protein DE146DRAFT_629625 [Phaeosphaeria sp. MPI-PUGE-AT-0046c]|nr:hypothetical protein DE146DRAFT_629625 [Phaeosphaeria sp. MPI-PUGE-AT-0046c]
MALAKSTLLTLPRELRNEIYKYLHKTTDTEDNMGDIQDHMSTFRIEVHTENAPLSNVLLVNTQIHAEYLESDCFVNLRATVKCFNDECNSHLGFEREERLPRCDGTLARLQHLTLFLDAAAANQFKCTNTRSLLLKNVMAKASKLHSLHLLFETQRLSTHERDALLCKSLAVSFPREYLDVPKTIVGMKMVQHGHGYYTSTNYLAFDPGDLLDFYKHEISGIQVLQYARHDTQPNHRRFDKVFEKLPQLTTYIGRYFRKIPDAKARVREWAEISFDMDDAECIPISS